MEIRKRNVGSSIKSGLVASTAAMLLAGCLGGSNTPTAPAASTLGGVAAVGFPIATGNVNVSCASGNPLSTATNGTGGWQVTLSGQTLPCGVRVSGGSINGTPNTTPYHSIATAPGTVNITPLTDLMVANLIGTDPATWFANLTPGQIALITQANVDATLAKMRGALNQLTPLATVNPITTAFTPAPGNTIDDMLAALATAMANSGTTYASLLTDAAAPVYIAPQPSFGTALSTAYAGTASGGNGTGGGAQPGTLIATNAPAYVGDFTPAIPVATSVSGGGVATTRITWTETHNPNLVVEKLDVTFHAAGSLFPAGTPATIQYLVSDAGTGASLPATLINCAQTPAVCAGMSIDAVANTVSFVNVIVDGVTLNGTLSYVPPTVGGGVPPAPTGLSATAGSASQINLSWAAATGATGYNVYRGNAAGTPVNVLNRVTATPVTTTSYSDTGLTAATPYYYTVTAVNASGESVGSTEVTATTSAAVGGVAIGTQMGGARQGVTLALAGAASVFAGGGVPAMFNLPTNITTDGLNLFVVDTGNNRIRKIVIATGTVTTLAGSGAVGFADATGLAAIFNAPAGITTDGTNLFVLDNGRVRKIVIATGQVTTLAGPGAQSWVYADGTGAAASFPAAKGITTDGTNLYVTDSNRIRQIVIATGQVTTLAGSGVAGFADGTSAVAAFNNPLGIATDGVNLYVADSWNGRIRKVVIANGQVSTLAGSGVFRLTDGIGTAAAFLGPEGLVTDGTNLYVTDGVNIRKIALASAQVTTLTGAGIPAIIYPQGITTDGVGLYVVDNTGGVVHKIQ